MENSLSTFSNLLLTIYRLAQTRPIALFQDEVLDSVKQTLQFDSSMWGTATMTDAGIDIHSIHLHKSSQAMLDAYDKVKHLDHLAVRLAQQARATLSFNASDDVFRPQEMQDFLLKFGHCNGFITSDINPLSRFVHWISLYRAGREHVCTPEEVQLLEHLAPHLMQALAVNRLIHLEKLTGNDTAREAWAVAIADNRGMLYHTNAQFQEHMRAEWSDAASDRLPGALLEHVLGTESRYIGNVSTIHRSLEHGLLFLKARARCPVDDLSTREYMVARLLASGLSQKEVALKLNRSVHTINSQVRTVFNKLGINSVPMLAEHLVLRG